MSPSNVAVTAPGASFTSYLTTTVTRRSFTSVSGEDVAIRILLIITKTHSRTHRYVLRNLAHIPLLANRHTYLYLCEFYKLYKNMSPILFNDMEIVKNESIHSSRAAAHCDIKIQRMNKRVGQRSVNYLGPITFNSLPTNIKTSLSFSIFKKRLREKLGL